MGLAKKTFFSSGALFSLQVLQNILNILRLILIARFLSPADYGVLASASLVVLIVSTVTQTGITQALMYHPNEKQYFNTAWTLSVGRGVLMYVLILAAAPLFAHLLQSPESLPVIQIMGSVVLIESVANVALVSYRKQLEYNRVVIVDAIAALVNFGVSLTVVVMVGTYWAFVYGTIVGSVITCLGSYCIVRYRPRFEVNHTKIAHLMKYGKWIAGTNGLLFVFNEMDTVVVGSTLGTPSLGLYHMAYKIASLPSNMINTTITTVAFPVYTALEKNINRVRTVFLKILDTIFVTTMFLVINVIIYIDAFVQYFMGDSWKQIIVPVIIFSVWTAVRSIGGMTGPVFEALGTPSKNTSLQLTKVILMAICIFPLTYLYGITGTAMAILLSGTIPSVVAFLHTIFVLNISFSTLRRRFYWHIIALTIFSITAVILKRMFVYESFVLFLFSLFLSSVLYVFSVCVLHPPTRQVCSRVLSTLYTKHFRREQGKTD